MISDRTKYAPNSKGHIEAYLKTCFRITFPDSDSFDVYVGNLHPKLDAKLYRIYVKDWVFQQIQNCTDWSIFTAYDLSSKGATSEAEDEVAQHKLLTELKANDRVKVFDADGLGGEGHRDKSVLVLGLDLLAAFEIGKRYGQYAIVCGQLDNVARLVGCLDSAPQDLDEKAFQKHIKVVEKRHCERVLLIAGDELSKSKRDITCSNTSSKELVLGIVDNGRCLVVIPIWNAHACAHFWEAIDTATTWRELKKMLSRSAFEWVLEQQGEPGSLADEFYPSFMDNGGFPYFPPQRMEDWMPPEILSRHEKLKDSFLSGTISELSPEDEAEIVSALEAKGYTCLRDDKLVQAASGYCGYWRTP